MLTSVIALGLLPLLARTAPVPLPQDGPGIPGQSFELYAYGTGFGGLPVFYWNGLAYLGDPTLTGDSDAAEVIFSQASSSNRVMVGNPKLAPSQTPSWSNVTYFLPSDTTAEHQTGFISGDTTTSEVTTGFVFYGNTAAWADASGNLQTKWYATPYEDTNIWLLNWDQSTDSSSLKVQVTLRNAAPSVPPPNPPGPGNPDRKQRD